MNKTMSKRRGKTKDDKNKNQFDKRRKDNKTLSQKKKAKRGGKKLLATNFTCKKKNESSKRLQYVLISLTNNKKWTVIQSILTNKHS
jgi:hypothetical protein